MPLLPPRQAPFLLPIKGKGGVRFKRPAIAATGNVNDDEIAAAMLELEAA
jgi:hypothetical protein